MLKRQVIFKPKSVRQMKRYLKPPLSEVSAVVYFSDKGYRPFLLNQNGGISSQTAQRLPEGWEPRKEMLERVFVITMEDAAVEDSAVEDSAVEDTAEEEAVVEDAANL